MPVAELRASGADVVHLSPSHHFPTGVVMPIGRRQELLAWAGEVKGRYIIEDDYDSEFRFTGRPLPTLQSIDAGGRVIYTNTFSKSLAPSIRISYMVLPGALMERFRRELSFYACTVTSFEQYTLARFLSEGHFERHINRMKKYYRTERDAVLHFLLRVRTQKSDAALSEEAAAAGIRLSFLSEYLNAPDPAETHEIVVNYSGVDAGRLAEAFDRLAAIL